MTQTKIYSQVYNFLEEAGKYTDLRHPSDTELDGSSSTKMWNREPSAMGRLLWQQSGAVLEGEKKWSVMAQEDYILVLIDARGGV